MVKTIIKRDGRKVRFSEANITAAIQKAGEATKEFGAEEAKKLADKTVARLEKQIKGEPTVEQVQDIAEETLLTSRYKKTAKAYIIYRDQHQKMRELTQAASIDLVDQYLGNLDWKIKENSNMGYSLQGLNNYISSAVSKTYWLNKIYPKEIAEAHQRGDVHIHDLNLLSVYCVGWDLMDLLHEGFKGVSGKIATRPAKHFRAILGQVVNFFYTLQGEAAGAQAFSNFDTLLAPFIRYDHLNYKEVKQALQEFVFNVNVPTRVGFQTPFTNITLDLNPPSYLAGNPVIIGGEMQEENYGDFQDEMNVFNRALLEVLCEGDADGRVFTFPIPTYNITKDFDWDNPVIDNLWEASAKYGIPYFSNFVNSDMNPEDARSMCCRLRIDNRQLEYRGGGLFGANPMTGSIGVVTINLPRLALKSRHDKKAFMNGLNDLMELAKNSLEIKRKTLERLTDANLYPYTKFYLRNIKKGFNEYWKNHFSTVGLVGMNEAVENLLGVSIGDEEGKTFAEEVLDYMRDRLVDFQEETNHNYNLEATPAEGTTYRLAQIDQRDFDDAIFANGVGKKVEAPFYTNSTHLPVNFTDDMFELLDLQDNLQTKYTGGTVIHFFLGERISDPKVLKTLVKTVCQNYRLPYFTFSPSFSVCPVHGYLVGEQETCEKCHSTCEIYSRVVGFLRPVSQWNNGKQAEFAIREHVNLQKAKAAEAAVSR